MRVLKLLFTKMFKLNNLIYFLLGCSVILFKYITEEELRISLFAVIIVINSLLMFAKPSYSIRARLKHLNWIFIPLFLYAFFFEPKIIGLLMIAHLFSDTIARIVRSSFKPLNKKYFPKDIIGSLFFVLSFFILSLLYIYYFHGFIDKNYIADFLKKYTAVFLITSLALGILENSFAILKYPDNLNINIFGILVIPIAMVIKLTPTPGDPIFGLLMCIIPTFLLVLFDIINLKKAFKYYLVFILLYTGFGSQGYHCLLFNIFILTGMGIIKKIHQYYSPAFSYHESFMKFKEIKEYFIISIVLVFIYYFLPYKERLGIGVILKMSMVVGLISGLLHYLYLSLNSFISKKFISIKKIKISREILLFNVAITVILLFSGYLLDLLDPISLVIAFVLINILSLLHVVFSSMNLEQEDNRIFNFLLPYLSFKIFFLIKIL